MDLRLNVDNERLINSIKTAIACLLGFFAAHFFNLPMAAWVLITIIVVMSTQINVGGVVIKSTMRLLGTLVGALASGLVLLVYDDHTLAVTVFLFLSIFIFSYIAGSPKDISNVGLLGAATVVMIVLSDDPTYKTAILRFIEISIAILIAFIVSKFLFPIHAYQKIYEAIAATLENYIELYQLVWIQDTGTQAFLEKEEKIIAIFATQRKLMHEAGNELSKKSLDKATYANILTSQREIFRYICFIHHALIKLETGLPLEKQVSLFNQHVYFWLEQLAKSLRERHLTLDINDISNHELLPLIREFENMPTLPSEQHLILDAFFFCALNLVRELRNLTRLIGLLIEKQKKPPRLKGFKMRKF
ncbi:MAG: FUSC family protein [Gammaproteobacteria bacterium]|nr:FUSC family protein [Gammaproteobacteria bacterium]